MLFIGCLFYSGLYILICLAGVTYIANGIKACVKRQALVKYRVVKFTWLELWTFSKKRVLLNGGSAVRWGIGQIIFGLLAFVPLVIGLLLFLPLDVPFILSVALLAAGIIIFFLVELWLNYLISPVRRQQGNYDDSDDDNMHTDEVNEKLKNIDDDVHSGIDPFYESKHLTK